MANITTTIFGGKLEFNNEDAVREHASNVARDGWYARYVANKRREIASCLPAGSDVDLAIAEAEKQQSDLAKALGHRLPSIVLTADEFVADLTAKALA